MNIVYNRYIPQSDGSFQRNRMADKHPNLPSQKQNHPQQNRNLQPLTPADSQATTQTPPTTGSKSFIRQLLPENFDTGDLLIVLLLLLIGGDREEEKSNALLTLALYFFM